MNGIKVTVSRSNTCHCFTPAIGPCWPDCQSGRWYPDAKNKERKAKLPVQRSCLNCGYRETCDYTEDGKACGDWQLRRR